MNIQEIDKKSMEKAQKRWDNLTKPLGSLGELERLVCQICGILHSDNPDVSKKNTVIMCADNGIVEENVSSCDKKITAIVTENFTRGITGINVFSKFAKSDVTIVDIGVDKDFNNDKILNRKLMYGTKNFAKEPAMTREITEKAIQIGIDIVADLKNKGYNLINTGEMGIGNTTTSSAVASVMLDIPVEKLTGVGSGLTKEAHQHKINIIKEAIAHHRPDKNDPIDVLTKVGGLDLAGLCGVFIGGGIYGVPVIIDGLISSVAALMAWAFFPEITAYLIPSHGSAEPGAIPILSAMKLSPYLNLGMRLGEGTGGAALFNIIDLAFTAYREIGTFEQANYAPYKPL